MKKDPARFLETVRRQLGASDARLEYGGEPPQDERAFFADLGQGWRVVALFDEPVSDAAARRQKLMALGAAFPGVLDAAVARLPIVAPPTATVDSSASQALDDLLHTIATMTGAHWVGVIDTDTDIVFGSSSNPRTLDDDALVQRAMSSVHALSDRHYHVIDEGEPGAGAGWLARPFGGIYWVMMVFDAPFSELAADGQLVRALPLIQARVFALTPREPDGSDPARSNVVRLRK